MPKPDANPIFQLISQVTSKMLERCRIPGCTHMSSGMVCVSCSRFVCHRHGYLTAALPPKVQCASCIIDAHADLLEHEPQPGDPPIIEAEVVG